MNAKKVTIDIQLCSKVHFFARMKMKYKNFLKAENLTVYYQ